MPDFGGGGDFERIIQYRVEATDLDVYDRLREKDVAYRQEMLATVDALARGEIQTADFVAAMRSLASQMSQNASVFKTVKQQMDEAARSSEEWAEMQVKLAEYNQRVAKTEADLEARRRSGLAAGLEEITAVRDAIQAIKEYAALQAHLGQMEMKSGAQRWKDEQQAIEDTAARVRELGAVQASLGDKDYRERLAAWEAETQRIRDEAQAVSELAELQAHLGRMEQRTAEEGHQASEDRTRATRESIEADRERTAVQEALAAAERRAAAADQDRARDMHTVNQAALAAAEADRARERAGREALNSIGQVTAADREQVRAKLEASNASTAWVDVVTGTTRRARESLKAVDEATRSAASADDVLAEAIARAGVNFDAFEPKTDKAAASSRRFASSADEMAYRTMGLTRTIYFAAQGIEDLQYSFAAVVNNIPLVTMGVGQMLGATAEKSMQWAAGLSIVSVGINQLILHWGDLTRALSQSVSVDFPKAGESTEAWNAKLKAAQDQVRKLKDETADFFRTVTTAAGAGGNAIEIAVRFEPLIEARTAELEIEKQITREAEKQSAAKNLRSAKTEDQQYQARTIAEQMKDDPRGLAGLEQDIAQALVMDAGNAIRRARGEMADRIAQLEAQRDGLFAAGRPGDAMDINPVIARERERFERQIAELEARRGAGIGGFRDEAAQLGGMAAAGDTESFRRVLGLMRQLPTVFAPAQMQAFEMATPEQRQLEERGRRQGQGLQQQAQEERRIQQESEQRNRQLQQQEQRQIQTRLAAGEDPRAILASEEESLFPDTRAHLETQAATAGTKEEKQRDRLTDKLQMAAQAGQEAYQKQLDANTKADNRQARKEELQDEREQRQEETEGHRLARQRGLLSPRSQFVNQFGGIARQAALEGAGPEGLGQAIGPAIQAQLAQRPDIPRNLLDNVARAIITNLYNEAMQAMVGQAGRLASGQGSAAGRGGGVQAVPGAASVAPSVVSPTFATGPVAGLPGAFQATTALPGAVGMPGFAMAPTIPNMPTFSAMAGAPLHQAAGGQAIMPVAPQLAMPFGAGWHPQMAVDQMPPLAMPGIFGMDDLGGGMDSTTAMFMAGLGGPVMRRAGRGGGPLSPEARINRGRRARDPLGAAAGDAAIAGIFGQPGAMLAGLAVPVGAARKAGLKQRAVAIAGRNRRGRTRAQATSPLEAALAGVQGGAIDARRRRGQQAIDMAGAVGGGTGVASALGALARTQDQTVGALGATVAMLSSIKARATANGATVSRMLAQVQTMAQSQATRQDEGG